MDDNKHRNIETTSTAEAGTAVNKPTPTTAQAGGYVHQTSTADNIWLNDKIGNIPWYDDMTRPFPNPETPITIKPNEPELPHNPGLLNYGWICPKCGSVFSPDTKECPYCCTRQRTVEATFSQPQDITWHSNSTYKTNTVPAQEIENRAELKMPDNITSSKLNS